MTEFEQALRTLSLPASRMERDRLMFLAGQASADTVGRALSPSSSTLELRPAAHASANRPKPGWLWPAATAVSTCCAAVLAVLLVLRNNAPPVLPRELAGADAERDREPAADQADKELSATAAAPGNDAPPVPAPAIEPARAPLFATGLFAFTRPGGDSRRPTYLQLRRLVLERGAEALPISRTQTPDREPMADAEWESYRPLRAIDRPRYAAGRRDEVDSFAPLRGAGNL